MKRGEKNAVRRVEEQNQKVIKIKEIKAIKRTRLLKRKKSEPC